MNNFDGLKLFICCHKLCEVPAHPFFIPIQVGAALAESRFPNFCFDDIGENISAQNPAYCELTAQYWAWKNVRTDYVGFFHYRRYLYPDFKTKCVYSVRKKPALHLLKQLGYDDFPRIIAQHDMILPRGENMYMSVEEHYANAPWHHRRDLDLVKKIVREKHPQMEQAMEQYLSGTVCYFGNIYIMRWSTFCEYCAWLFPIMKEFDQRADVSHYSEQERRVDGYLAERLLGIYYTYHRHSLKTMELPRVHFYSGKDYFRHRLQNAILPPGSWRRSAVKKLRGWSLHGRAN